MSSKKQTAIVVLNISGSYTDAAKVVDELVDYLSLRVIPTVDVVATSISPTKEKKDVKAKKA